MMAEMPGEDLKPPADGADEGNENSGREDTYFLPKTAVEGRSVNSGDILKFRVVGKDSDGNIEVEAADDADKSKSWQEDMRANVTDATAQPGY